MPIGIELQQALDRARDAAQVLDMARRRLVQAQSTVVFTRKAVAEALQTAGHEAEELDALLGDMESSR